MYAIILIQFFTNVQFVDNMNIQWRNSTYEKLDDKELVNQALYMTAYLYEGSDIYPDQFEPDKKID